MVLLLVGYSAKTITRNPIWHNNFTLFTHDVQYSTNSAKLQTAAGGELIAEADRTDSVAHLWSDFQFVLKKVGVCRAELTIGAETRQFYIPQTLPIGSEDLWTEVRKIRQVPHVGSLTLYGEKESLSANQFSLLVDIATEAAPVSEVTSFMPLSLLHQISVS